MSSTAAETAQDQGTEYHGPQNHCFGCGPENAVGLRLKFVTDAQTEDGMAVLSKVSCSATLSQLYEGPPGYVHGGIIATLLDEAMSKANRARGVTAMTRQMQVEYRRPVPSGAPIRIEGTVTRSEGRKHWTAAKILDADGTMLAEASGMFIAVTRAPARAPARASERTPERAPARASERTPERASERRTGKD